jgi:hypothetical protein
MIDAKKQAHQLILKYYYSLPNNGSHNVGINNCESRYREAISCALICVDIILNDTNQFMQTQAQSEYWKEVHTWIERVGSDDESSRLTFDEFKMMFVDTEVSFSIKLDELGGF